MTKDKIEVPGVLNGNIFSIMGHLKKFANHAGWSREEFGALYDRVCESSSYEEALSILREHFDFKTDSE